MHLFKKMSVLHMNHMINGERITSIDDGCSKTSYLYSIPSYKKNAQYGNHYLLHPKSSYYR